ncbi:hypothetical protein PP304_gp133 [Gordonia phage Phendrix]|uniref:Uncharacterized protein n=2 Tax=Godonkavirus TaxID=2733178 RepID=A0A4D6E2D3_9CAUD|nr:hypothetical protein HOV33_gp005 [Gordonia phage GodonK]YP_009821584.1 hypothetical protein HOV33_gp137 [Gordonia phage GodonK]YP_010649048.1 hypothetical protein PP304_gp004 [Gordonia phage Phendrix]YP_010649234.1 hypothetical protein PP304_gp133 [Gordonia phage Phendrix]QBZ72624.1 hypothetical protein SEA_GODONK_5 [Gordonia phage GodonK]QBZ72819.1 hypothetical protein SEA_GODONK_231 [Gordonia phage GodonK]QDK02552.1 hypothetical protein SEA_PHENDRIX_4 [Gordonia phage Phendrix]QDK02736.1
MMSTKYYGTRDHVNPSNDEHAAMCHVNIATTDDWQTAKDSVVAYINDEVQNAVDSSLLPHRSPGVIDSYRRQADARRVALHDAVRWQRQTPNRVTNGSFVWIWTARAGDIEYTLRSIVEP